MARLANEFYLFLPYFRQNREDFLWPKPFFKISGAILAVCSPVLGCFNTAQKKDGLPVTHFLDFARDYSKILTKGGNVKLITIAYPSKVAYSENFVKGGRVKVAKSLDNDEEVNVPVEVSVVDFLTNASEEALSTLLMTKEEANAIAQRIIEEEESNRIFWEECKQFEEEIIKTPVEDLAKSVRKAVLRTKGNYDDENESLCNHFITFHHNLMYP